MPTPAPRKTSRITHSTSTTSSSLTAEVDPRVIYQARIDFFNDILWKGRESYRETLQRRLLRHANSDVLSPHEYQSAFNIVRYNDELRARTHYDPAATLPPIPPLKKTPITLEEPEAELPDELGPELPVAEPGTIDIPTEIFDPPLPAAYIGRGLGFRNGTVVDTLRKRFADFPAPHSAGQRATPLWLYSEVGAFVVRHVDDIERMRSRGSRQQQSRAETRAERSKFAREIAQLQAELAALKARHGEA